MPHWLTALLSLPSGVLFSAPTSSHAQPPLTPAPGVRRPLLATGGTYTSGGHAHSHAHTHK